MLAKSRACHTIENLDNTHHARFALTIRNAGLASTLCAGRTHRAFPVHDIANPFTRAFIAGRALHALLTNTDIVTSGQAPVRAVYRTVRGPRVRRFEAATFRIERIAGGTGHRWWTSEQQGQSAAPPARPTPGLTSPHRAIIRSGREGSSGSLRDIQLLRISQRC